MLAVKLFGPEDIRLVECEIPRITADEILVKTTAAAICGSDLRMIENGYRGVDETHPLTLGHEISGIIAKMGENVTGYRLNDRVTIAPNFGCGHCKNCREGDYHLCEEYRAFGINIDGGFAEYIRVPKEALSQGNVIRLGDEISAPEAAVMEPAACVLNGQERVEVEEGDNVLVIGAGPIGVLHVMLAKARGAADIYLSDLSAERLKKSAQIAPYIIPLDASGLEEAVMEKTRGKGVDVCIVACASGEIQEKSLGLMNTKGRVLFFGGLPQGKDLIRVHSNILHYGELKVCGSTRCSVRQCESIVAMVKEGKLRLRGLISRQFEGREFMEALKYARSGRGLKTVLIFGNKEEEPT